MRRFAKVICVPSSPAATHSVPIRLSSRNRLRDPSKRDVRLKTFQDRECRSCFVDLTNQGAVHDEHPIASDNTRALQNGFPSAGDRVKILPRGKVGHSTTHTINALEQSSRAEALRRVGL